MNIKLKNGNLLEETHYYPFGLPIHNLGTAAAQQKENRLKYQSNEYIEDNDLRWMNFNARQYDPQIGRFLSIDPLAYQYGQQIYSPYAAMGNNPGMMVDPNGTRSKYALDDLTNVELMEAKRGDILGSGFSSTNVGGLKVSLGMNNTMLEYAGGGGFNVGSNVFSNFGKVVRKFFSLFGNKASSNVEPSTGNSTKEESKDQTNDGGDGLTFNGSNDGINYTYSYENGVLKGSSGSGVNLKLHVNVPKKYTNVNFIQTYENTIENCVIKVDGKQDGNGSTLNYPFYWSKENNEGNSIFKSVHYTHAKRGYTHYFDDTPGTLFRNSNNYVWTAYLTVVGKVNGKWVDIISFEWQYSYLNGNAKLDYFRQVSLPNSNKNIINKLK